MLSRNMCLVIIVTGIKLYCYVITKYCFFHLARLPLFFIYFGYCYISDDKGNYKKVDNHYYNH